MTKEKAVKFAGIIEYLSMNNEGLQERVKAKVAVMTDVQMEEVKQISDIIAIGGYENAD
jgi:hypothetical protein